MIKSLFERIKLFISKLIKEHEEEIKDYLWQLLMSIVQHVRKKNKKSSHKEA